MIQNSKLLRRIMENATDDDVIRFGQSLGLGQNSANPNSTAIPLGGMNNSTQDPPIPALGNENDPPGRQYPVLPSPEDGALPSEITPEGSRLLRPRIVENSPINNIDNGTANAPANISPTEKIRQQIAETEAAPVKRENSLIRRLGNGLWKGVKMWSANGGQGGIFGLAGAAATGGLGSTFSPNFEGELNRADEKQRLLRQLDETQKQEDWKVQNEANIEKITNMRRDDEIKREEIKARSDERQRVFEENQRKTATAEADRKRANFYRQNKYFDPVKATEAQKRQLAEFGETPESVGLFDFSKNSSKTVAGVTYEYNDLTKSYEPTNLPKDSSKEIVEYEVTDPSTGITSKFATTSDRAAGLKTSLAAAQMQINAANTRQDKQIAVDYARLKQQHEQWAAKMKMDFAKDEEGRKRANADQIAKFTAALNTGRLTQQQYDELVNLYK